MRATLNPGEPWRIERVSGQEPGQTFVIPDRLAVEQQLARVAEGLLIQSPETIRAQRRFVLDPPGELADNDGTAEATP